MTPMSKDGNCCLILIRNRQINPGIIYRMVRPPCQQHRFGAGLGDHHLLSMLSVQLPVFRGFGANRVPKRKESNGKCGFKDENIQGKVVTEENSLVGSVFLRTGGCTYPYLATWARDVAQP